MKQMKFLLVALMAVAMSVSVTSCMNGDDNNIVQRGIFVKNDYTSFVAADGIKIVPSSGMNTLLTGTYYYIACQYDMSQFTENSTSLSVTLLGEPICIDPKSGENPSSSAQSATNPLYALSSELKSGMIYFDKNTLIMSIVFWYKSDSDSEKVNAELAKHSFYLSYDTEAIKADDTKLVLTINHVVTESGEEKVKRETYTSIYKAYTLTRALDAFLSKTKKVPEYIVLQAKTNSSEDKLKENDEKYSTLELEYPFDN